MSGSQSPLPPSHSLGKKLIRVASRPVPEPTGWRAWLPFRVKRTSHGLRIRIAWKQALIAFALATVFGWLALGTTAYLFVKYNRGFPGVKFTHMLLYPLKKEEYRASRGDHLVAEAKRFLDQGKFREAYGHLVAGLGLAPANRDARLLLSQFFMAWQRPDRAEVLLKEGLKYHKTDLDYLRTLFTFLLQRQSDAAVLEITNELLRENGPGPAKTELAHLAALARATAQFHRGNYDAAEDTMRDRGIAESTDGRLLQARIDWDRGDRETAFIRLSIMAEEMPDNEQVYSQHSALLREAGRDSELRRLALLRQIAFPDRPRARIDLLYLYDKAKDEVSVQLGIEEIFRDFSKDSQTLLALGDFAASTGRPNLARRIYEHNRENLLPWEGPAMMIVEAYIVAKRYQEALAASEQLLAENPEWSRHYAAVFNGLQAIAHFGLGDPETGNLYLNNFLNKAGFRAENLVAVSNRLIAVGAYREARSVLTQAYRTDPLNQTALVGLIRLDLSAGNTESIAENLRSLMRMRKPPINLLREAYTKLGSDRFLFVVGRSALLDELDTSIRTHPSLKGRGAT